MLHGFVRPAMVAMALVTLFASSIAEAQWVLLARRVVGRVDQMSQTNKDGSSTFDTAAVIVDVPVDKVYATVKSSLERATTTQGITITREDAAQHLLEFSKGDQTAAIQVAMLGDNLTHMMVSSSRPTPKPTQGVVGGMMAAKGQEAPPTSVIVDRILAVCKEMNVECSSARQ